MGASWFRASNATWSLHVPAFVLALGSSVVLPALPVYARSFDVSFGVASMVVIIHSVGAAAATVPTGFLLDKIGRRKIILAGPVVTAAATFLMATAQSFPELLVYRFIAGWASQMWMLGRLALITDSGGHTRGRQITGLFGTDSLGRLFGPVLGGVTATLDLRIPFVVHGLLALLAVIPSVWNDRGTPELGRVSRPPTPSRAPVGRAMALRLLVLPFVILFALQALVNLARGTLFGGTLHVYAVYEYGVGPEVIGALAMAASAVGIPLTFMAGHFMDRYGRKTIILPALVLLGLAALLAAATAFAHAPFLTFVVALLGMQAANSLTSGSMQTLASDAAPEDMRGRFFGIWRLVGEVATFMSPLSFVLISEGLGFGMAFTFIATSALLAALLYWTRIPEGPPSPVPARAGGVSAHSP